MKMTYSKTRLCNNTKNIFIFKKIACSTFNRNNKSSNTNTFLKYRMENIKNFQVRDYIKMGPTEIMRMARSHKNHDWG